MAGENINRPTLWVLHLKLVRAHEESVYKSECPVCHEGMMLVARDDDGRLSRLDICVNCGQKFIYTDRSIGGEKLTPELSTLL